MEGRTKGTRRLIPGSRLRIATIVGKLGVLPAVSPSALVNCKEAVEGNPMSHQCTMSILTVLVMPLFDLSDRAGNFGLFKCLHAFLDGTDRIHHRLASSLIAIGDDLIIVF